MQAAWLLLLQRYTGQPTVAFGATVSGRPSELQGIEQQIGLFINTLPVIASPRAEQHGQPWLQRGAGAEPGPARARTHAAVRYSALGRAGRRGAVRHMLVFENYPVSEALEGRPERADVSATSDNHEQTNYPVDPRGRAVGDTWPCTSVTTRALFPDEADRAPGRALAALLRDGECAAATALGELNLLDAAKTEQQVSRLERHRRRLTRWSARCTSASKRRRWRTPEAAALVFAEQTLTYAELNAQANRLAHRLIAAQGVGAEVLVGIARRAFAGNGGRPAGDPQGRRRLRAAGPGVPARAPGPTCSRTAACALLLTQPSSARRSCRLPPGTTAICLDGRLHLAAKA